MDKILKRGKSNTNYPVNLLALISLVFLLLSCGVAGENGLNNFSSSSVIGDSTAPSAIADLTTINPTADSIELKWTAPGDDGDTGTATSYDIRYFTSITDSNWDSAIPLTNVPKPEAAGSPQSITVSGLTAKTTYYFAIKTSDEVPNTSNLSNFAIATPGSDDTTAPGSINDLTASNPTSGSIYLSWTAPGDDVDTGTAASYDIRYSTSSISVANWSSATRVTGEPTPKAAGTLQSITVTGLAPETTYYFAIRTLDEVPNTSELSNVEVETTIASADTTAPGAINDLTASNPTSGSIYLSWTAPGDDVDTGTAASYDIRYSTSGINDTNWSSATRVTGEPAPKAAGTLQSITVTGLVPETTYYFAMKTADEVPNTSDISNESSALTETASTDVIKGSAYYVAPDGSDTNDGSINSPWATIQYAIKNSGPGDTVYLRDGTYIQGATIRGDHGEGGANGQFWTLKAYPGENPVIKDSLHEGIKIYMTKYVRVEGLTFDNGSVGLYPYVKDGYALPSHTEILNNKITGPQLRYNMLGVLGDDNLIEGNTIIVTGGGDSLDHGIYVMSGSRNTIRNNYISGHRGFGIHIYDEVKQGRDGQIADVVVEGNIITGSVLSGGIIVATGNANKAKNIIIRNNIIYANGVKGIEVRSNSQDVYIYNNTIYRNGENGDGIRIAVCCGSSGFINGVTMKNNLIDIGSSTGYHINVGTSASVVSNIVLENNLYWPGSPDLKNISDANPVTGDPIFVDSGSADFHLRSGSAAIDAGLTLTDVTTDKEGISRPQGSAYDIGAYEYH